MECKCWRDWYLDDNVRSLSWSSWTDLSPLLRYEDDAAVLFVPPGILLALVQDAEIVRLCDADKLAVVAFGPHHTAVVQFIHCGRYSKTEKRKKEKKKWEKFYRNEWMDVLFFIFILTCHQGGEYGLNRFRLIQHRSQRAHWWWQTTNPILRHRSSLWYRPSRRLQRPWRDKELGGPTGSYWQKRASVA